MQWLTERVTRYSIGVTMQCGYREDAMEAGLVRRLELTAVHLGRWIDYFSYIY